MKALFRISLLVITLGLIISPAGAVVFTEPDVPDIRVPLPAGVYLREWVYSGPYVSEPYVEGQPLPAAWTKDHLGLTGSSTLSTPPAGMEWRPLDVRPNEFNIDLLPHFTELNEHCVVYVATHVWAPRAVQRELLVGSDDGIAVWINGKLVHQNHPIRASIPDSDRVPVSLHAGWNVLVLKITQAEVGWGFVARFNDNEGLKFSPMGREPGTQLPTRASLEGRGTERPAFDIYPYIQNLTTDAVTLMWQADRPSLARIDLDTPAGRQTYITSKLRRLGQVRITGLDSGEAHGYRVTLANSFKTAGERAAGDRYAFRTLRENPDRQRFILVGDSRSEPERFSQVLAGIMSEPDIDIVLHSGDIVGDGNDYFQWIPEYFKPAAELKASLPVLPVLGNHENNSDFYYNYYDLPHPERWWSTQVGSVYIAGLDSNHQFHPGTPQHSWLIADLERNRDIPWKIIMLHHPAFTSGPHGRIDEETGKPAQYGIRTGQELFPELAREFGIQFFVAGHDHIYERSENEGVHYLTAGGGGAPTYTPRSEQNPYSKLAYSGLSYFVLEIEGNKATLVGKKPDGEILETVEIPVTTNR